MLISWVYASRCSVLSDRSVGFSRSGGPYNEDHECSVLGTNTDCRLRYSRAVAVSPVLHLFVDVSNNLNFVARQQLVWPRANPSIRRSTLISLRYFLGQMAALLEHSRFDPGLPFLVVALLLSRHRRWHRKPAILPRDVLRA